VDLHLGVDVPSLHAGDALRVIERGVRDCGHQEIANEVLLQLDDASLLGG